MFAAVAPDERTSRCSLHRSAPAERCCERCGAFHCAGCARLAAKSRCPACARPLARPSREASWAFGLAAVLALSWAFLLIWETRYTPGRRSFAAEADLPAPR